MVIVTASDVKNYFKDPFELWANHNADKKLKDPKSDYFELLTNKGNEHEAQVLHQYNAVPLEFDDYDKGYKLVLDLMKKGERKIANAPVSYPDLGLSGKVDLLERVPGKSKFGDYYYVVKEIKLAKSIKHYHKMQAAFYNFIIGKIQEFTPKYYYLINGAGESTLCDYDGGLEKLLLSSVEGARKLISGEEVASATYGVTDYPWSNLANTFAIKAHDVSLVDRVSSALKRELNNLGIKSYEELSKLSVEELVKVKGVGNFTALKIIRSAESLVKQKPLIIDTDFSFPRRTVELFLDFEGVQNMDYLIGLVERREFSEAKYIPFLADDLSSEGEMLNKFLHYINGLNDFVIYHYGSYERKHFQKLFELYNTQEHLRSKILNNLYDLHRVVDKHIVFPIYGTGLKPLAKYFKFNWRHKEVNAMESSAYFVSGDSKKIKLAVDYNEDDCFATIVVKDNLLSFTS